jgi:hypothetical protein
MAAVTSSQKLDYGTLALRHEGLEPSASRRGTQTSSSPPAIAKPSRKHSYASCEANDREPYSRNRWSRRHRMCGAEHGKKIIERTEQKISVKFWRPLIGTLNLKIKTACLRRDPYIANSLALELPLLDREISVANSAAAE